MIRLLLRHGSSIHSAAAAAAAQNPSLRSISTQNPKTPPPKFIATHLSETYNLSASEVLSISAHIHLKNPEPILSFLKDLGFTGAHIAKAIATRPRILGSDPELTLRPRWQYLHSLGLSRSDLADLFATNPSLFYLTLQKKPTQLGLAPAVSNPNMDTLSAAGVSIRNILKMLQLHKRALSTGVARFRKIVADVQGLGLCPSKPTFSRPVAVLSGLNKESLNRKWALYKSLGWSDEGIREAFRAQPCFLGLSDDNIKLKIEFLVGKVGLPMADLTRRPVIMMFSLRKRLEPRCSVMKVLMDRGLIERRPRMMHSVFGMPDSKFFDEYVVRYEKEAPEVVKAAKGEIGFEGWEVKPK